MWQHQPRQGPAGIAGADISGFPSGVTLTFNSAYPPGAMFLASFQGPQTIANASTTGIFLSTKGDEVLINTAGPFSFDASSAFYIRWRVWRAPSGYAIGDQISFLSPNPAWPATTYLSVIHLVGCTQFLGYYTNPFTATANVAFSTTVTIGAGTQLSAGYRSTTTEIALHTTATAAAWNGVGNPGITPDAGSWTSFTNASGTSLGVSNWWATFTQRPPLTAGINGRYTVGLNGQVSYLRFGGG